MIKRLVSILVILLVAGLVLWLVRRARQKKPVSTENPAVEPMVACAHCDLHIPRREAIWDGDTPYCGEAHRRAGPRQAC